MAVTRDEHWAQVQQMLLDARRRRDTRAVTLEALTAYLRAHDLPWTATVDKMGLVTVVDAPG